MDAGLGERVPTFEEVLETTTLAIHAELKVVEAAEPLASGILEKAAERITLISFDPEALRRVKRALPDQPVGLILSGAPPDDAERARSLDADLVSLEAEYLSAEAVERCRRAALKVTAWTVNEPEQMQRVVELGVDGIATDRPDLLAGIVRSRVM